MNNLTLRTHIVLALVVLGLAALTSCAVETKDLETRFQTPPREAGVRCWWWWLNSNVTKEAITRDLEEIDRGIAVGRREGAKLAQRLNL